MITQTHDLNLIPGSVPPVVNVTQYDKTARTLVFNLWDGETSFSVPSGAAVTIRGTKPDGNGFEYPATASGSAVSMNIQQQMATCAGSVRCEVRIASGTQIIGTADFILEVKPSALNENTVISETDLPIFEQLVSDAQTAASDAQTAAEDAAKDAAKIEASLEAKQDKLTFDSTPVFGSANPVTSDGIYQSQDTQNTAISTLQTDMDTVKTNVSTLQTDMEDLKTDKTYGAGSHNSLYRGKSLGNAVTDEQLAEIEAGTFKDLYIGDYWTIGDVNWRIAGFDYWLHTGDTECTTHHLVIVPDTILYSAQMNTSNVTTGAYVGSAMYTSNLAQAKTTIKTAFGDHILTHRERLQNAVSGNYESGGTWYDSTVELMNERMVYGCDIFHGSAMNNGTSVPNWYSIDKSQLPLFRLDHSRITNRAKWWLRDVVSSAYFALVDGDGGAGYYGGASDSRGVRPAFGICK